MGQNKSKPIRIVVNESDAQTPPPDDINNNVDTLGVDTEENDYPDPRPPGEETRATTSRPRDRPGMETDKKIEELTFQYVPVGASFLKFVKRQGEPDPYDMAFLKTPRVFRTESSSHTPSRLSVPSRPVSKSLWTSTLSINTISSESRTKVSQRERMLVERIKHENRALSQADTLSISSHKPGSQRGQVRRFTLNSPARLHTNFQNIEDSIADEVAETHRNHRAESYLSLLGDLTAQLHTDRLKVKVILAWMSKQNIGRIQFSTGPLPPDTPNGYMELIQCGQGTFPVFFALMCRAANIKCAIISGISKGTSYQVGDTDTSFLLNTWNAVFVEGEWKLVHPLWVCRGMSKRVRVEEPTGDGTGDTSQVKQPVNDVQTFNQYFIFTKPEEFVYRNLPDDDKWQLLPEPITKTQFLEMFYLRHTFFLNLFKLLSADKCVQISEFGEPIEINIGYPTSLSSDLVFGYKLTAIEEQEVHDKSRTSFDQNTEDKTNFVLVNKGISSVTFEVRFTKTGQYKLQIFGGRHSEFGDKPPWILDLKLICQSVQADNVQLPVDPGPSGWGPGAATLELGLYVPSHFEGVIYVSENEPEHVYFILAEPLDVIVELLHGEIESQNINQHVKCNIELQNDILVLHTVLSFPGDGEYVLRMEVKRGKVIRNACNYVVRTRKERPHEPYYQRKARRMLLEAMRDCNLTAMQEAMKASVTWELPETDPDLVGAKSRLEFLECKNELHIALLVHRIDVAEHALYRTRKANLEVLLEKEIRRVEAHLKFLLALDTGGWMADIPSIDRQTLVELGQLYKPRVEVKLVLNAMYMLLGLDESFLKNWRNVQSLLRDQEATLSEMARLEKYLEIEKTSGNVIVDKAVVARVDAILVGYTEDMVRKVNNTLAAYFRWVSNILTTMRDLQSLQALPKLQSSVSRHRSSRADRLLTTATRLSALPSRGNTAQFSVHNTNEHGKTLSHTAQKVNKIFSRQPSENFDRLQSALAPKSVLPTRELSRHVASHSGRVLFRTHAQSIQGSNGEVSRSQTRVSVKEDPHSRLNLDSKRSQRPSRASRLLPSATGIIKGAIEVLLDNSD